MDQARWTRLSVIEERDSEQQHMQSLPSTPTTEIEFGVAVTGSEQYHDTEQGRLSKDDVQVNDADVRDRHFDGNSDTSHLSCLGDLDATAYSTFLSSKLGDRNAYDSTLSYYGPTNGSLSSADNSPSGSLASTSSRNSVAMEPGTPRLASPAIFDDQSSFSSSSADQYYGRIRAVEPAYLSPPAERTGLRRPSPDQRGRHVQQGSVAPAGLPSSLPRQQQNYLVTRGQEEYHRNNPTRREGEAPRPAFMLEDERLRRPFDPAAQAAKDSALAMRPDRLEFEPGLQALSGQLSPGHPPRASAHSSPRGSLTAHSREDLVRHETAAQTSEYTFSHRVALSTKIGKSMGKAFKKSERKLLTHTTTQAIEKPQSSLWYDGPESDDDMHDPGEMPPPFGWERRIAEGPGFGKRSYLSWRGLQNWLGLFAIAAWLVTLFLGMPLYLGLTGKL
ncbi:uncharacterized protein L969DRAFT_110852 [Mixia osmundae IAM 14324]|uniref:Uncharacterized protein n=1 Tax=Mixia osmundae (strain CBS 9802 / IAM 14324 / JCM 22182 / KY 12970) TaxID=764103 RepID=G7DSP8_MIXOS|nr:uncharacterized protein L969DRAFT_110852 [Mixia osmundae IAM 14324]KEI41829.1 hypothetical protein L969DRAFT_110852 [Mixia osmundae IAM 14324]GAA93645.1 hypothetical protein E5Q_00289 [Mixia osmundae IAM 14324]